MSHRVDSAMRENASEIIVILIENTIYLILFKLAGINTFFEGKSMERLIHIGRQAGVAVDHIAAEKIGGNHCNAQIIILEDMAPGGLGRDYGIAGKEEFGSERDQIRAVCIKTDGGEQFLPIEDGKADGHPCRTVAAVRLVDVFEFFHTFGQLTTRIFVATAPCDDVSLPEEAIT